MSNGIYKMIESCDTFFKCQKSSNEIPSNKNTNANANLNSNNDNLINQYQSQNYELNDESTTILINQHKEKNLKRYKNLILATFKDLNLSIKNPKFLNHNPKKNQTENLSQEREHSFDQFNQSNFLNKYEFTRKQTEWFEEQKRKRTDILIKYNKMLKEYHDRLNNNHI